MDGYDGDGEYLVGCAVEVAGAVHCVAPLGGDYAYGGEVGFDGACSCGRWEATVVDEKRLVLD